MLDWIDPNPGERSSRSSGRSRSSGSRSPCGSSSTSAPARTGAACWRGSRSGSGSRCCSRRSCRGCSRSRSGLVVLVAVFVALYRPETVVRFTGGPRKEWSALHEGRELFVLVAERAGRGRRVPTPRSPRASPACPSSRRPRPATTSRSCARRCSPTRRTRAGFGPCAACRGGRGVACVARRAAGLGAVAGAAGRRRGARGLSRRVSRRSSARQGPSPRSRCMDDLAVGRVFRAARVRRRWRQGDVAAAAGVSRADRLAARARAAREQCSSARSAAVGGGARHPRRARAAARARTSTGCAARITPRCTRRRRGSSPALPDWVAVPEVTFSIFGERGAIDILAWHAPTRSLLVIVLKTELVDVQETVGTLDRKVRLATRIARERGWDPLTVSTWLLVAESPTTGGTLATTRRCSAPGSRPEVARSSAGCAHQLVRSPRCRSSQALPGRALGAGSRRCAASTGRAPARAQPLRAQMLPG